MKVYQLEILTKEFVAKYFQENSGMEIKTKTGPHYHIVRTPKGKYCCFSNYMWNERKLTKEMKKVFC